MIYISFCRLNVVRSSTRSSHSNIKPLETSLQQSNDYCDIITDNIYETISDNVNNTVYQNTIPQDVREYTGYDLLNRRIPTQVCIERNNHFLITPLFIILFLSMFL